MLPKDIFHDNNLGQDNYTAFLSALNQVPDHYTYTGCLDKSNLNVTYSYWLFLSPPRDATKLSLGREMTSGRMLPNWFLLASISTEKAGGPCCWVLHPL